MPGPGQGGGLRPGQTIPVRPGGGGGIRAAAGAQSGLGNELADRRQRLEAMKQVWVQKNYPQLSGIAGAARMTPELQAKIDQEFQAFMEQQIAKAQQQPAAPPPAQPGVPAPPPGQGPGVSGAPPGGAPPPQAGPPAGGPPQAMAPPPGQQLPQPGLAPRGAPAR